MAKKGSKVPAKVRAGTPVPSKVYKSPVPAGQEIVTTSGPFDSGAVGPPKDARVIYVQASAAGSSGTKIYGGYFSEEYLINELHGTAAADAYDKMRRSDAKLKMALNAVTTPIIASDWAVHPATEESEEHKLHARFIDHVLLKDMDKPFSKVEQLSLVAFGHLVQEVTHKPVFDHPEFGSYVGLRSLGWRSPRSILYWRLNPEDGSIDHIRQLVTGDLGRFIDIPGQFLLVASLEKEGDNYEGVSLLRAAYGAWKRKNLYLRLMAIGIERNSIPTPTVEVPAGKQSSKEYDFLVQCLENYTSHENSWLAFPAGWKLDFLKHNFDPDKLKSAIDFENSEEVGAFMANFLLLGSTQSGSRAVSMDQSQFFLGALQYIADEAVSAINHKLIPELIKMKFGPQDAYPTLKVTGIEDKGGKELADSLKALAESQYIQPDDVLEEAIRKRYKLPKKSDHGVRIVQAPKSMQAGDNVHETDDPDALEAKAQAGLDLKLAEGRYAIPDERRYPIGTVAQASDALRRSKGKPGEKEAWANILKKYPGLDAVTLAAPRKKPVKKKP